MNAPVPAVPKSRTGARTTRFVEFVRKSWGKLVFVAAIIALPACFTLDDLLFSERVPHGVRCLDADLSRMTPERAAVTLRERAIARLSRPLKVEIDGRAAFLVPGKSGVSVNAMQTVERARGVRRARSIWERFVRWNARFFETSEVLPVLSSSDTQLRAAIERVERETLQLPTAGALRLREERFVAEPPRAGRRIEREPAVRALLAAIERGESRVRLRSVPAPALLSAESVEALAQRANDFSRAGIVLSDDVGMRSLSLEPSDLRELFSAVLDSRRVALEIDPVRLTQWLVPRRGELETAPVAARFEIGMDDRVDIVPSQLAQRIDESALALTILRVAASEQRLGELPFEDGEEAEFTTRDAEGLGIRRLVSSFTTQHACCERRVENIHRIAEMLDGVIVRPGEKLSVNAFVGPRTEKNGFVPAPAIEAGEFVDTVGGGISQFATTLFNALFYGGYDIIERQAHTYWFSRYPMGHEATLSYPKPDLVFKNDTKSGMLLDTVTTKTSITVRIFGDNEGRSVQAVVSERKDIVEPALEIRGNRALTPEEERVKEPGMIGWTVTVGRILTYADGTQKQENRVVTYRPRPRRIEVHPCRIPKGEKGYTGERCPAPPVESTVPATMP